MALDLSAEDAALAKIVAAVDDVQSKFVTPMSAVDADDLSKFRVDPADVSVLPQETKIAVDEYGDDATGRGYVVRTRIVKDGVVYERKWNKGPRLDYDMVETSVVMPGPMTKLPDGSIEDADVVVSTWLPRGWVEVENDGSLEKVQ